MLKLLVFVPCEKVLIDQASQSSAIGLIERITVATNDTLEPTGLLPFRWSILILWHRDEEVPEPVQYEVHIILRRPDGTDALHGDAKFEVSNKYRNFRQNVDIPLMPIGIPGEHMLILMLRKEGEKDWQEITSYPIGVAHTAAPENNVEIVNTEEGEDEGKKDRDAE